MTDVQKTYRVTREELDRLLNDFQDAIMEATIRSERQRSEAERHESLEKWVKARDAVEKAVLG